jgi:predicted nucleic acid-binding protein
MARRTGKPVARSLAFWDSSALVLLCVRQTSTPQAIEMYRRHELLVWWAAPVEIASALARLVRMRQLNSDEWTKARQLALDLADSWSIMQPSDSLRSRAAQLVDNYDLRAADSFQLAAALEWCQGNPQGRSFLSADQKLRQAAALSGFNVIQM